MSIVAALDKVLFFNASSKYSVLRMKTEDSSVPTEARSPYRYHDHLIRFTAVGIELPQTDTVKIEMDGEWKDGKYGLQLQVDHWQEIVPPTLEGVRNYLASGLLKGIGEKTADAIIEKFGINALEILEHQPDRLLEIRSITKERLAEIKDAYAETSRMRVLMTLLAPFKVTPTTAQKIYQHFGPACADIVRQSPFNLCQVPGFGFKRIDAIVQKSGGDLRDPKRVHGALFYALEDARTKDGHLYLEAEALLKAAMQLLNERIPLPQMRVPMSQVEQELSAMIRQDEVVSNHGNVYLPKQFLQESETAQKAVELFLAKPAVVDIAQPLERVKHSLGLNLSKRQSEGVGMVFRHNLSIITGGPGTGKTTVLKTVIEVYRQLYPQQKIVLGAPTGKASRRMAEATGIDEAQTLHSILGLHGDSESKKDRERKPLEAGLLIVDETSMVDMWLIHQLFSRLRPGTKVLLVGDADQLESVGAGDVFHELIGSGVVPVTVLDEIFRQAQDSLIAHNARFINEGKTTLYYGEDFAFHKAESQEETAGIIRELYREQIAAKGIEQVEILSPFRSEGEASVNSLNEAMDAGIRHLRKYAQETDIPIDGIVVTYNDASYAKSCGRTGHHYKDGLAFKFEDDSYETVLRSIEWTPSRTGEITPVAVFDTVEIDGCAVSRASLHNLSFIENLELAPGCRIKVSKRNQIIPHVEENLDRNCYSRDKVVPARCPCCGQPTRIHMTKNTVNGVEKVTAALFCDNEHCETRKLRKFVHFASPKALNIMGLSESILEKFIGKGWLHSYMDIFALDKHRAEIVQMEGFGEKSWQNLWDAIQHSRITTFEQYLTAMDIPMVGSTASKAICQRFRGNLAEFETAVCQSFDFTQLPDFGETLHRNICQWFRSEENWTIWTELRRLVCIKTYQPPAASTDMGNPFVGKTLVVTGKVEPYTRDGINAKIESLGAHAGSSVSSKTDYLICGENAGSKLAKAQELGIKILSPDEFFRMAGESA